MTDDGDARRTYERWVTDWSMDLYRMAYRLCGQAEVAEDLLQETFYHAWRSMDTLREPERARAWLFQILRFRWSHYVRSEVRRPHGGPTLEAVAEPADGAREEPLEKMARQDSLQQALGALEERYRVPLLMVFIEGMTCREAAAELEIPLGTVLSRIHRGRKFLRERLTEEADRADAPRAAGHAESPAPMATAANDQLRLRLGGEQ